MKTWPGGVKPHRRSKKNRAERHAARGTTTPVPAYAPLDRAVVEKMTVAELRVLCDNREIKWNTKIRKAGLIEMLVGR